MWEGGLCVCVHACICVCEREREREGERFYHTFHFYIGIIMCNIGESLFDGSFSLLAIVFTNYSYTVSQVETSE